MRWAFDWCARAMAALQLTMVSDLSIGAGDPARGAAAFQACAACHSITPGVHLTGPSLANIWDHKAGKVEGFSRYSEAMKRATLVWNEATLDTLLRNPDSLLPGTSMTFQGIDDSAARHAVIAYLKSVSEGKAPAPATQRGGGMMGQPTKVDLNKHRRRGRSQH